MEKKKAAKGHKEPEPQGQVKNEKGRDEEKRMQAALEELALLIFKIDLAHRLIELIMLDVIEKPYVADHFPRLEQVQNVLSSVDSLLRKVRRGATAE